MSDRFCAACEAKNTLEARIERLARCPEIIETFIVCTACGERTHAAYTNDALEAQAARARSLSDRTQRWAALSVYRLAFEEWQAAAAARLGAAR